MLGEELKVLGEYCALLLIVVADNDKGCADRPSIHYHSGVSSTLFEAHPVWG